MSFPEGAHHSEQTREKMKASHRKNWENPEYRKRMALLEPIRLKKLRVALQDYYTPEVRQEYAESMAQKAKKCWQDPSFRAKKVAWINELVKVQWQDPEFRQKQAAGVSSKWKDPSSRPQRCTEISERMILKWKDESYKNEQVSRLIFVGHHFGKPNKAEKILIDLIDDNKLPFKYVGDGSLIIGGKNPDFFNINGKKQLLELFGGYWHRGQNPQDRISCFKEYGFDCLVIWESELKEKDKVVEKLANFAELGDKWQ